MCPKKAMDAPIRLLISACLLGEKVRYDGGHKREAYLVETLGRFVEWVRVCPEVDCGLPVPRESMRLVGDPAGPRLVGGKTAEDFTSRMERFARDKMKEYETLDLCGYICKKDSPSSGMERVKIYNAAGVPERSGSGAFTRVFLEHFPLVPVEEEGRLHDPVLREMFVERVFCLRRWRTLVAGPLTRGRLIEFHTDHKLLLLSHGRTYHDELGRLVARAKLLSTRALYDQYLQLFVHALKEKATVRKISDVLLHMVGHFKTLLSADEKQELLDVVAQYHARLVPLVVPLTLVRHHVRTHGVAYLERQVFLHPHPVELMLRNHV
jgi:uncharacterized protein YbgA (DUF1722 family)/uncharacterized protein YbbK (DUF523 family)